MMNDGDFFVPLTLEYYNAYAKQLFMHNASLLLAKCQCAGCEARAFL